jgi:hypothetical protein
MANITFNIGKGRIVELYKNVKSNNPANSAFVVVLLKAAEADAVLKDYDDLSLILAEAGNTEADFTNYARKTLTDADIAALPSPNDTTDAYELTWPDLVYSSAGGATNNTMTKLILCYDEDTTTGTDADIVPLGALDYTGVTDGSTITIEFPAAAYSAG